MKTLPLKAVDKDLQIAILRAENANLRHDLEKNEAKYLSTPIFRPGVTSVPALEREILMLMTINQALLKALVALLGLVKKKKCTDYWDDIILGAAENAIKLGSKKNICRR